MTIFNQFVPSAPFLYPLKTSENRKGVQKGCIGNKWVKLRRIFTKNLLNIYATSLSSDIISDIISMYQS